MANWIETHITITNPTNPTDKKGLKALAKKIKTWGKKPFAKHNFCGLWLGNIVGNSGITISNPNESEYLGADGKPIECRGDLEEIEFDELNNSICITQYTAWTPMLRLYKLILEKYYPQGKIDYTADDECGNFFWTSDESYATEPRYELIDDKECERYHEIKEGEIVDLFKKRLGSKFTSKTEARLRKCFKQGWGDFDNLHFCFNRRTYVSVDEVGA